MKTVLLVPGFLEDRSFRNYDTVLKVFEAAGYQAEFVPIAWRRTTINDWVSELGKVYEKYNPNETILSGFSFGSMTALVAASKRLPAELWLFSLSPYFAEDIPNLKQTWLNAIGKRRIGSFGKLSFDDLARTITCPVKLFVGEKEMKRFATSGKRFEDAAKKFQNCQAMIVPGAEHDVADSNYIAVIKTVFATMAA